MNKNKSLEMIKHNKRLQKRLNLSIDDYKEYYYQFYKSSIEVELKIDEKKYGLFVNIPHKEEEYYHIYFDDSNEEIKRNYLYENEKVNIIKIIIDYQVKSFKGLFYDIKCINSIKFNKFYRINITDMSEMFSGCSSLKELNLTNFNTNNATNMSFMFNGCSDDLKRKIKSV